MKPIHYVVIGITFALFIYGSSEDIASALGRALGAYFIPFLIAYLISKNRNDSFKQNAYSVVVAIIFVVALVKAYDAYQIKQLATQVSEEISKLTNSNSPDASATDSVAPRPSQQYLSEGERKRQILSKIEKFIQTVNTMDAEFTRRIENIPIDQVLLPLNLISVNKINVSKNYISEYEKILNTYVDNSRRLQDSYLQEMRTLMVGNAEVNSFEKSAAISMERTKKIINLERDALNILRRILNTLEPHAAFNQVSINNSNQLVIDNSDAVSTFNTLLQRLEQVSSEQESLKRLQLETMKDTAEKIRKTF